MQKKGESWNYLASAKKQELGKGTSKVSISKGKKRGSFLNEKGGFRVLNSRGSHNHQRHNCLKKKGPGHRKHFLTRDCLKTKKGTRTRVERLWVAKTFNVANLAGGGAPQLRIRRCNSGFWKEKGSGGGAGDVLETFFGLKAFPARGPRLPKKTKICGVKKGKPGLGESFPYPEDR